MADTPLPEPAELAKSILEDFAFNPNGLPKALRDTDGQIGYLEAVAKGVIVQQDFGAGDADAAKRWTTAVAALLLVDGFTDPAGKKFYANLQRVVVELAGSAVETSRLSFGTGASMYAPEPETQRIRIFALALKLLTKALGGQKLFLQSVGRVLRAMADRHADHRNEAAVLGAMVKAAYDRDVVAANESGGGGGGIAQVDLPPLADPQGTSDEIEPDNIRAVATIYVSYQLEFALKALSRVLDLFVAGLLPISASDASARELDTLYWNQDDLLDEASRRSVYARVLGAPGGEIAFDIQPNTEFNTLLMRVVSAVSEFEREQSALTHFDNASRGRRFQSTSGEFVRKAVRDFAANASLRGWAGTAFMAERMARHVNKALYILGLPSVRNAFGVSTAWQVIERVSQREFGITVNTVLQRTLAIETQTIMRLIADNHGIWSSSDLPLFPGGSYGAGTDASGLDAETTRALMVACQHFRAVTGVGDQMLADYSEPVEVAAAPSLPGLGAMGGMSGGAGIDMGGIGQLRDMVASGQTPSLEQLRAMLPGY